MGNDRTSMEGMMGQSNLFMEAKLRETEKKVTVINNGKEYLVSIPEAKRLISLGGKLKDGEEI